ncbi:aminotransferase class V-fold PLP-dependent enzyme [bacterium]|nr:aminotransferase class V-fold PLP-dependent enzyme [bacterium]
MIYLDNAATTFPKPPAVLSAMEEAIRMELGNPGRSGHAFARRSDDGVASARQGLARLFHAEESSRIILTMSGTDSLNIALKGLLEPGDHVVTGELEHNSVLRPLAGLGVECSVISFDEAGYYRVDDIARSIRSNTRLVALTHGSNVLGTRQPIDQIGAICRDHRILLLVDAAQTAGCVPIDVQEMKIDLLTAPGHKSLFGPMGTGLLYVGPRATLRPWREGGTGGDSLSKRQPIQLPTSLEAGTPNVPGLVGLAAGVAFVDSLGWAEIRQREDEWRERLVRGLSEIPRVELLARGRPEATLPIVSFRVKGFASQDVAGILDSSFGIAVRAGLHCAPLVHEKLGSAPEGAVRVSGSVLSTLDDVDAILHAMRALVNEG